MIYYAKHFIDRSDIFAVSKVLDKELLTQGKKVIQFQNSLNKMFKAKYSSVVSNGTAALHLAGYALNWKKNDYVITTPITFLASVNCILYHQAIPILVDIDKDTFNIDLNFLEDKIKNLKKKKKLIKSVIAVDFGGNPCDWNNIKYLSSKYKFSTINDNCHAIGSKYNNDIGYAVRYADLVTHSYHPAKNFTTGEGGAVLTNNKNFFQKIELLKSHGVIKKSYWNFDLKYIGYNYRLSDISCALGISQLKKLNNFLQDRRKIAKFYTKSFSKISDVKLQKTQKNSFHSHHLFILGYKFKNIKHKKNFFEFMKKKKINLQVHYVPIFHHSIYKRKVKFDIKKLSNATNYFRNSFSIPIYPGLTENEQDKIVYNIKKFLL